MRFDENFFQEQDDALAFLLRGRAENINIELGVLQVLEKYSRATGRDHAVSVIPTHLFNKKSS